MDGPTCQFFEEGACSDLAKREEVLEDGAMVLGERATEEPLPVLQQKRSRCHG
jgi:hypothetical protein